MNSLKMRLSSLTILGALTVGIPAWADEAPDNECFEPDLGQPCNNATDMASGLRSGICKKTTCTRATPDGLDTYDCYSCLAIDGGTGGQPNEHGGAAAGGSSGRMTRSKSSDDGGCSFSTVRSDVGAFGVGFVALGALAGALRRRRSQPT